MIQATATSKLSFPFIW